MGFFLVMKAELVRSLIIMRRYWFATVISMVMGYSVLLFLVRAFVGGSITPEDVQGIIDKLLGLIIGMFAFGIVGMFSSGLQGMARTGELEQLCMSPHGLITNFLARSAVSAVTSIISLSIVLTLLATHVGGRLHAEFLPTVVLLALTYTDLIGFGFMVGGLVLVFKQTGQLATMVRLGLLGLAVVASDRIEQWPTIAKWVAHALPITDAAICLKYTLIQGQLAPVATEAGSQAAVAALGALNASDDPVLAAGQHALAPVYEMVYRSVFLHESFLFLVVNCALWTAIGIVCFRYMENVSRDKGTLGAY